jgi:hypothetical protein
MAEKPDKKEKKDKAATVSEPPAAKPEKKDKKDKAAAASEPPAAAPAAAPPVEKKNSPPKLKIPQLKKKNKSRLPRRQKKALQKAASKH